MTLKLDMLFPGCPDCQNEGMFTEQVKQDVDEPFKCLACEQYFHPEQDTLWDVLLRESGPHKRDYIGVEMIGRSPESQARVQGISTEQVKRNVREMEKTVNMRTHHA